MHNLNKAKFAALIVTMFLIFQGCWGASQQTTSRDAKTDLTLSEKKTPLDAEELTENSQAQEGLLQDSKDLSSTI